MLLLWTLMLLLLLLVVLLLLLLLLLLLIALLVLLDRELPLFFRWQFLWLCWWLFRCACRLFVLQLVSPYGSWLSALARLQFLEPLQSL